MLVPASRLAAFAARMSAQPASSPGTPVAPFVVLPPGTRPFYCLVALALTRHVRASTAVPPGLDYCGLTTPLRTSFLTARDTGRNSYLPYKSGASTLLVVQAPVYRGGSVPHTVAARRAAFLGAFASTVAPEVVLGAALRGHPGIAVEFRNAAGSSPVAFRARASPRGAQTATLALGYGWTMRASGEPS